MDYLSSTRWIGSPIHLVHVIQETYLSFGRFFATLRFLHGSTAVESCIYHFLTLASGASSSSHLRRRPWPRSRSSALSGSGRCPQCFGREEHCRTTKLVWRSMCRWRARECPLPFLSLNLKLFFLLPFCFPFLPSFFFGYIHDHNRLAGVEAGRQRWSTRCSSWGAGRAASPAR
jgi:hypothetical protein